NTQPVYHQKYFPLIYYPGCCCRYRTPHFGDNILKDSTLILFYWMLRALEVSKSCLHKPYSLPSSNPRTPPLCEHIACPKLSCIVCLADFHIQKMHTPLSAF